MYCPRCSQEQPPEALKFCSRCGLPLALVSEILAHDGNLPRLAELEEKTNRFRGSRNQTAAVLSAVGELGERKDLLTRRNGLIFSLFWFLFFVFLLTPIFGGVVRAESLALLAALLGMIGGAMLFIASFVLLKNEPLPSKLTGKNAEPEFIENLYQKNQNPLPPEQSIPISTYLPQNFQGNWRGTKDLIQPSVIEDTTKLLEKRGE